MEWFELGPFTVFDVETTGMSPVSDRIVQLAAVRVERDGRMSHFASLVNPERPIPPGVIAVHHVTDDMVKDAPTFRTVGPEFTAFACSTTLVAHNAHFDLGFLQEGLNRCGCGLWQGKTMDTLRLLRKTHPGLPSYRLQYLREFFRLDSPDSMQAHRADSDVEWTVQVLAISLRALLNRNAR